MKNEIVVNGVKIKVTRWTKGDKDRLYFEAGRQGKACWDLVAGEWIKQHGEFGWRFKAAIKAKMEL